MLYGNKALSLYINELIRINIFCKKKKCIQKICAGLHDPNFVNIKWKTTSVVQICPNISLSQHITLNSIHV